MFNSRRLNSQRNRTSMFDNFSNLKKGNFFYSPQLAILLASFIFLFTASVTNAATAVGGNVTIDVPSYNAATGWTAGVIYDAKVTANFTDTTSTSKKVSIILPEGMRLTAYPVLGTPIVGSPGYKLDPASILAQFVTAVTQPSKQTYYPSYNGTLSYDITSACESVEIPLKITVDENVYYGPKVITDGITANASKNGSSIGEAKMNVSGVGSVAMSLYSSAWINPILAMAGSTDPTYLPTVMLYRSGLLYPSSFFAKEIQAHYYYPKESELLTSSDPGAVVEVNSADGCIVSKWNNRYATALNQASSVSVQNTSVGLYTSISKPSFQITMYDGFVVNVSGYSPIQIDVKASADNKLDMSMINVGYYKYADDYYVSGPRFRISSSPLNIKERQNIEYTIDPNYEVIQAVFPKDATIGVRGEVQYKTNLNPSLRIAAPDQITVVNSAAFAISKASLGLSENEYITYAKASIGNVSKGFESISLGSIYALANSARTVGKLKDGVNTANVTVRVYALLGDGNVEPNSENIIIKAINRISTAPIASLATSATDVTMNAGQTKPVSFLLRGSTYYYDSSLGMVNPTAYIRVPKNTEVNLSTIKAMSNYDGILPITVTGPYVSSVSGETFIKVAVEGKVGSLFDLKTYTVTLSFDLMAGMAASGNYDWSKYVFWKDDAGLTYIAESGNSAIVSDTMDVDNDGNITEKIIPALNKILSIIPKQELIIDTYIVPEGETRKPAYNGTAATAIGFTPGTTAKYTLEALNNRTDSVNEMRAYIPVPREGINFGSQFQSNPFYWNMKLSGTPTVKVYDASGNDITATAGAHYVLAYSDDATNESNYASATYGTGVSDATAMIRLINTSSIPAGEKAVLSFDYVVNETIETVAENPAKLGATNDFRPYYYFNAGTAGWQNGTRVGAMLQIGQIAGKAFLDNNKNGIYEEGTDAVISNKTVNLYKKNTSNAYILFASAQTDANGTYSFDGLANGVYKTDFNPILNAGQEFTLKDQGEDDSFDSDVAYSGAAKGAVESIDPTSAMAKNITAGIINYAPATELFVSLNKATTTLKMTNAQTSFTEQLTNVLLPEYFDNIKAATQAVVWSSSDPTTVSVSNGLIQGSKVGSATVTLTIKDMYGNTKSASCVVTVTSNAIPSIQAVDRTLVVGDIFDPLTGVSASDSEDGNMTGQIVITSNNFVSLTAGTYHVSYSAIDSDGNTATKTIVVFNNIAAPSVSTQPITSVISTSATGNGNIASIGGENPIRQIEWGTTPGTYSNSCSAGTGAIGNYSCQLTNLVPNTIYYVRAKATNSGGSGYGNENSFTTPTLPAITILNPDINSAQSKIITASADKGDLAQSITSGSACDTSLTFSTYQSATFSSEADNGKKICYRSIDVASGTSYLMSSAISGIDTTVPEIAIANPDISSSQAKTITASANEGTLTQSIISGTTCDNSLTFSTYQSTIFSSEADNGKKICYQAIDAAANTTYLMSNAIAGIDRTAPAITIDNPDTSAVQVKTITASANEGILDQAITSGTVCDNSLTFSTYQSTTFSDETDNGKKVCYQAIDIAANTTYLMSNAIAGIDRTAPIGTAIINNDANFTNTQEVAITNDVAGAAEMRLKNESEGIFSNWISYVSSYLWSVASGDGIKTVYSEFRDAANNIFGTSDTITLDTVPPALSSNNDSNNWKTINPIITLSSADNISLSYSKYAWDSDDAGCRTDGTDFTDGDSINIISQGAHVLYLCNSDDANNTNNWSGIYKLDSIAPAINSVTSDCQNVTEPNFIISATDDTSILAASPYSFDGGTTWQSENNLTYQDSNHTIPANAIQVKDQAGNISSYGNVISRSCVVHAQAITAPVANIKTDSAIANASISNAGGENAERAIEWGIQSGTYTDSCSAGIGTIGSYSCQLANLVPNTIYYVRAKAINSSGTSYGNEISFTTLPLQVIIVDPNTAKITNALTSNYVSLDSGSIVATPQVITNTNIIIQNSKASINIPVNTEITNSDAGNFNFQAFTALDVSSQVNNVFGNSRVAVKIGVPNTKLTFSNLITLSIDVNPVYNGMSMDIFYQNDGESDWHSQGSCIINDGKCTFTTDHATTYSVNGDGSMMGNTGINLNTDVQEVISLDCGANTINLGNLTPGTPITGSSTCTATTNANGGYNLSVRRDDATSTLKKSSENSITITDLTPWDPAAPNANTYSGIGLGFTVYGSTANKNSAWWGTGTTLTDSNNRYAGFATAQTDIMRNTTYADSSTATDIGYMLNVPPTQKSGAYSGSVTYQAVTTP